MNYRIFYFIISLKFFASFSAFSQTAAPSFHRGLQEISQGAVAPDCCLVHHASQNTQFRGGDPNFFHQHVNLNIGRPLGEATVGGEHEGISILSEQQAQDLFNAFRSIEYLPFEYLDGGCEARAHEFALIAERHGINMLKAFMVPENDGLLYPKKFEYDPNAPFLNAFQGWRYHVAPSVVVRGEDGSHRLMVFDVGPTDEPTNIREWIGQLSPSGSTPEIIYRNRDYIYHDGNYTSPNRSIISSVIETQRQIEELGESEYVFRVMQGWL